MTDTSTFPDPTYRDTVLAPLFEGVKTHYATGMDQINRAHLVMLRETGILGAADAASIGKALCDISANIQLSTLTYTGAYEDYFFWIEAQLKERLSDLGGALHTARSRNDMDHTLFKMALRDRASVLMAQVLGLAAALTDKAEEEAETLIVAYTHGQPAQPSTFGHYLAAAVEVLLRDTQRLEAAITGLDHCPMGAAAITTSGFPIDRERMADLLGFAGPLQNSYGCIASVDYITGLYSSIKLIFLHLGRVIQDMAFWSAFEVGQLYVPNALVQVSSIMPQKRNPVPIEHLRHLSSVTVGRCDMVVNTMHNTPFTDMNDSEGEVQQAGYATFDSGGRVLALLKAMLPACSINADRVQQTTDAACITITELADTLVRHEGLSFRAAHEIASRTARSVISRKAPLKDGYDDFVRAFHDETGRVPSLDIAAFQEATSAQSFIARRDRTGGPAKSALIHALAGYRQDMTALRAHYDARLARIAQADKARNAAFHKITET